MLGLARGFFVAGARSIVGSLWPVRDDEAAIFFDAFYRHLARGLSVSAAAAGARRERMAAGDPPAAWAGIVVTGDGSYTPFPARGPSGQITALAAMVSVALLSIWILRRRRR